MAQQENPMVQNRSTLKDFIGSISTMSGGDLSNITAPPFVLDTKSTVELPQYWADHPSIFCAPAQSSNPAERAMLVLRWYLSSQRNQNYMGRGENDGLKKPLNAFLGELFLGRYEGDKGLGETKLVGEQVSHHPPITACRVWNETHGVSAEGYTRQTITFNGSVTIQQTGHALFTLSKHDESYLIPLPTLKVRGILSGAPYPELGGKYYITSTSGYTSVVEFSGKGWFFNGKKNSFQAKVYQDDENKPLYTIKGQWNGEFTIHDMQKGTDIETFDVSQQPATAAKLIVDPLDEQDPWETRRAWKDVIGSLNRGDMPGTSKAKSIVEQGQRNMRKDDEAENRKFQPVFFRSIQSYDVAEQLQKLVPGHNSNISVLEKQKKETLGIWVFNEDQYRNGEIQKPYHGELVPDNSHSMNRYSIDSRRGSTSSDIWAEHRPRSSRSSVASIYSEASSPRSSVSILRETQAQHQPRTPSSSNHSPAPSGSSSPRSSRGSLDVSRDSISSLSDMSSLRRSLDGGISRKLAREQPALQTERALRAQQAKGSGVLGMSVTEKAGVEDFLRDQYSNRRMSRTLGKSGLRVESRA